MAINRHSETWAAVEAWAGQALEDARTVLEQHGLSLEDSAFQRGRIACLRDLLGLSRATRPPEVEPPPDY